MTDWVLAAERAYIAAGTGRPAPRGGDRAGLPRARAAAGAIASRHLSVGAPRSLGLVVDGPTSAEAAELSLVAHQTWFQPTDLRCAGEGATALVARITTQLGARIGGAARAVSLGEALACDIACLHAPIDIDPGLLRRGTHLNLLDPATVTSQVARVARVIHEEPDLGRLAAGIIDGRQLDELTVFVIGSAEIALAAV